MSREWYEKVFGLTLEFEFPDDDGVVRGVAYSAPGLGDVGVLAAVQRHDTEAALGDQLARQRERARAR